MVPDGLVHYLSSMSFGWILANQDGHWLAATSGLNMGQGSSMSAKEDGMLSNVLFSSIITDEYPSKHCTIKYISDNSKFPP